jgi:hypothetical protein
MAIGTSTIAAANGALKDVFKGPIRVQFNEESSPIFKMLERVSETGPDEFKFPVEYGRHGGIGAIAETGDLPDAAARFDKMAACKVANIAAKIEISDKLIKSSAHSARAFAQELGRQVKNVTIDGKDMVQRNFNTDHFGVFGVVKAASGDTVTLDLDDPGTLIEAVYEGQVVDFGAVSAGAFAPATQKVQILNVDRDTGEIKLSAAVTAAPADSMVLSGDFGLEMTGLKDILQKGGVLYGINRADNKWFNPQVFDRGAPGAPAALNSTWIGKAIDAMKTRAGGLANFIACNGGIASAYEEEQREFGRNIDMKKIDGGVELMTYRGIPISVEPYFPRFTIGVLDTSLLRLHQINDWDWLDEDGSLLKLKDNKTIWWAAMVLYANVAAYKPAGLAVINGIEEVN